MIFLGKNHKGIEFEVLGEQFKMFLGDNGQIYLRGELGHLDLENKQRIWKEICEAIQEGCLRDLSE